MWKRVLILTGVVLLGACDDHDTILVPVDGPAPPVGLTSMDPLSTMAPADRRNTTPPLLCLLLGFYMEEA